MRIQSAKAIALTAALLAAAAATVLSLSLGTLRLPPEEVIRTLLGHGEEQSRMIVMQLRLPRALAALMVGAAMGAAGALLQGVIRNPLASPDVLGITGGAAVLVVACITAFPRASVHIIPFAAAAGALGAAALNYVLAWRKGVSPTRLVMIGIGLSTAAGALTTFLIIISPAQRAHQLLSWTTGSLYGTSWSYVELMWPWLLLFLPLALLLAGELNVQGLGDAAAIGLGSRLGRSRLLALALCVALTGAAVGVGGTMAFIGLMAPHMARRLAGLSYRYVIPMSALLGAILTVLADLAGRTLFSPLDVPAGVFTAGIGAPFFIYLLLRAKTRAV